MEKVDEMVGAKDDEGVTKNGNEMCETEGINGDNSKNGDSIESVKNQIESKKNEIKDKNMEQNGRKTDNMQDNNIESEESPTIKDITVPESEIQDERIMVEIEDPDDYLIYLEDILKKIHQKFYEAYDKMESGDVPDLKKVIPKVRSQVLKDCKLVFSGLVPTRTKLEHSKAYQVARSLGAVITQDLETDTTHLVAVRPGTVKVNAGKKKKNLKIVTPDWLWCCAER